MGLCLPCSWQPCTARFWRSRREEAHRPPPALFQRSSWPLLPEGAWESVQSLWLNCRAWREAGLSWVRLRFALGAQEGKKLLASHCPVQPSRKPTFSHSVSTIRRIWKLRPLPFCTIPSFGGCLRPTDGAQEVAQRQNVYLACRKSEIASLALTNKQTQREDWRDGSAIKSTCCSSRGHLFSPQDLHCGSQP